MMASQRVENLGVSSSFFIFFVLGEGCKRKVLEIVGGGEPRIQPLLAHAIPSCKLF